MSENRYKVLPGLAACLMAVAAGQALQDWLGLPTPPAIIGVCLMLIALLAVPSLQTVLADGANLLLRHLGLLILPAAVGAIWLAPQWLEHWLALLLVIVLATGMTLAAVAWLLNRLLNGQAEQPE